MKKKIRDLSVGDSVDPFSFPCGFDGLRAAEIEGLEVREELGTPFIVVSDSAWVLITNEGGIHVNPDWIVEVS